MRNNIDILNSGLTIAVEGKGHTVTDLDTFQIVLGRIPSHERVYLSYNSLNVTACLAAQGIEHFLRKQGHAATIVHESNVEMVPESILNDNGFCKTCGNKRPGGRGAIGEWHDPKCQWHPPQ
jgi:hypothetical protein